VEQESDQERPTVGQQREFAELAGELKVSKAEAELFRVILQAAAQREEVIRGIDEAEAQAAEAAAAPGACAQRLRMECIMAGVLPGVEYRPQDMQRYNEARGKVVALQNARSELNTIYGRWPELFGLPENPHRRAGSWNTPSEIMAAATTLKINSVFDD
jgi:hypothetical protein